MRLVGYEVRCDDSNDAVPEPVRSRSETHTTGTNGQREDLANDDPGTWSPGDGEGRNVQADEGDHGLGCVRVVVFGLSSSGTDDTSDELERDHAGSTVDEQGAATKLLNHEEREGSGQDVDEGGNKRDEEGVLDGAKLLEEDGTEVEDEVDTGQLLHHLKEYTQHSTAGVGRWGADLALEASSPRTEIGGLGQDGHLVLVVGDDLSKFVLDVLGVDRLATDTCESVGSLVKLALLDEETGRVGEQHKTNGKDDGPEELDGDGDTVRASVITVLGRVNNAVGQQDANGDAELVTSNDGTADLARGDLGHVPVGIRWGNGVESGAKVCSQDDNGRDETDTETGNETTANHDIEASGSSLENTTDSEDEAADDDGQTTSNEVGKVTGDDGAEEGTSGEDGSDEGLLPLGNNECRGVVLEILTGQTSVLGIGQTSVLADEVGHSKNTTHPSRIITEEDATECGESDQKVCPYGNGGLDTGDIGGAGEGYNSSTRHDCRLEVLLWGLVGRRGRWLGRKLTHVARRELSELGRPSTDGQEVQGMYLFNMYENPQGGSVIRQLGGFSPMGTVALCVQG